MPEVCCSPALHCKASSYLPHGAEVLLSCFMEWAQSAYFPLLNLMFHRRPKAKIRGAYVHPVLLHTRLYLALSSSVQSLAVLALWGPFIALIATVCW
jgi:hypothetical protein